MRQRSTYRAFWLLYSLFRLTLGHHEIDQWLRRNIAAPLRAAWRDLAMPYALVLKTAD
jgi:hypothetical protein